MASKALLKMLVPLLSVMLVSACGYIKDIKEKFNPHESPVNARTEEPANQINQDQSEKTAKDDLNNLDRPPKEEDISGGTGNSKNSTNSDVNSDKPDNKKLPSKESTNR